MHVPIVIGMPGQHSSRSETSQLTLIMSAVSEVSAALISDGGGLAKATACFDTCLPHSAV